MFLCSLKNKFGGHLYNCLFSVTLMYTILKLFKMLLMFPKNNDIPVQA